VSFLTRAGLTRSRSSSADRVQAGKLLDSEQLCASRIRKLRSQAYLIPPVPAKTVKSGHSRARVAPLSPNVRGAAMEISSKSGNSTHHAGSPVTDAR
jgi:hypothetical protein